MTFESFCTATVAYCKAHKTLTTNYNEMQMALVLTYIRAAKAMNNSYLFHNSQIIQKNQN